MKRFALMYTESGSYTRAWLKALVEKYGTDILAIEYPISPNAPYQVSPLDGVARSVSKTEFLNAKAIAEYIIDFEPEAVYISGWSDNDYLAAARILRKHHIPVISGLDAQYKGRLRQRVATLISPWLLHSAINVMWAAGERQRYFAQRLGYHGNYCWEGLLCCDWERFALKHSDVHRKPTFLFTGRYVDAKGIDVLLEGYTRYRGLTENPWELFCAGAGPKKSLLEGRYGVRDLGFVQPDILPSIFHESGAFVLPSRHEPWGVVVQEAAAARLPLICSDRVGSAVHLVKDSYNGYVAPAEDPDALADCMLRMSNALPAERTVMGDRSFSLGQQYLPERWVDTLVNGVARIKRIK